MAKKRKNSIKHLVTPDRNSLKNFCKDMDTPILEGNVNNSVRAVGESNDNNKLKDIDVCENVTQSPIKVVDGSSSISRTLGDEDSPSFVRKNDAHNLLDKSHESETGNDQREWVNLLKDNRVLSQGMKMEFIQPKDSFIQLAHENIKPVVEQIGFCLVGRFSGRFPGLKAVYDIRNRWNVTCKVKPHEQGWVIFQFRNEEERSRVLENGPYMAYGKTLMLRVLPQGFCFDDKEFLFTPLWVQLPRLPIECWTGQALSMITSMIGKPICTDKVTCDMSRLAFARVLVEVDISKEPVSCVPIKMPCGKSFDQKIFFEHYPNYCCRCHVYGHSPFGCCKQQGSTDDRVDFENGQNNVQYGVDSLTKIGGVVNVNGKNSIDNIDVASSSSCHNAQSELKGDQNQASKACVQNDVINDQEGFILVSNRKKAKNSEHENNVTMQNKNGSALVQGCASYIGQQGSYIPPGRYIRGSSNNGNRRSFNRGNRCGGTSGSSFHNQSAWVEKLVPGPSTVGDLFMLEQSGSHTWGGQGKQATSEMGEASEYWVQSEEDRRRSQYMSTKELSSSREGASVPSSPYR